MFRISPSRFVTTAPVRRRFLPALVALVGLTAACSDPVQPGVLGPVVENTVDLFSLNGSPPGSPNALALLANATTVGVLPGVSRVGDGFNFDLVVDFTPAGPVLIPVKLVGSVLGGQRDVGLRKMDVPFDELTEGPNDGYVFSSTLPIAVGDVFAVVAIQAPFCQQQFSISQDLYAKLEVEAINTVARTARLHVVVDPNCGSRRLVVQPPAPAT